MDNRKKTALITGANTGIGLATAKQLLEKGYFVIGTSRNGKIPISNDTDLMVLQLDISDDRSIRQAAAAIALLPSGIDLLINNAGVGTDAYLKEPERTSFEQTFSVNVTGLVFFTEAVLNRVNENGLIVMLSSAMSLMENIGPYATAYRMSKAAVNIYVKMLAQRLEHSAIKVIALNPGLVRTNMGYPDSPYSPEQSAAFIYNCILRCSGTAQFWTAENASFFPL